MQHYLHPSLGPASAASATAQVAVFLNFLALIVLFVALRSFRLVLVLVRSVTSTTTSMVVLTFHRSVGGGVSVAATTDGGILHVFGVLLGPHLGLLAVLGERVAHAVTLLRRLGQQHLRAEHA